MGGPDDKVNRTPTAFDYRILWRSRHPRPGAHASTMAGSGHEFRNRAPLMDAPDIRRLALRASAGDPFGRLFVNVFNQFSAIPVYAVVDHSASMNFTGVGDKAGLLAEFLSSLAFSAHRTGDPFGLVACGQARQPTRFLPATRNAAMVQQVLADLAAQPPAEPGAHGLLDAATRIGRHRALVFLVSDFHLPDSLLDRLLGVLGRHQVVPVVLRDSAEDLAHAPTGLARVVDGETGRERTLWIRKATRRTARREAARRRMELTRRLRRRQCEPIYLTDALDRDHLNQHFARR